MREPVEELDLVGTQLSARPGGDVVLGGPTAGDVHQLPVGVAAHQHAAVTQPDEAVEDLDRHRSRGVVAGHHDDFGRGHVRLGEHGVEHRERAMDVGQDRDRRQHAASLAPGGAADMSLTARNTVMRVHAQESALNGQLQGQRGRRVWGGLNTSSV